MPLTDAERDELLARYIRDRDSSTGLKRWWRDGQVKRLAAAANAAPDELESPRDVGRRGRAGRGGGRVLAPRAPGLIIEGSSRQMPGLWPWTVGGDSPLFGAPLGHHLIHQRPVHFDLIDWWRNGYITAPVMVIIATNGSGKSTLAARLMTYAIATGRCPIAAADIKPDHRDRIQELGGQVVSYGKDIINPLAPGALGRAALRLDGTRREELRADMRQSQLLNMKTLIQLQRGTDRIGDIEGAILAEAIRELSTNPTQSDWLDPELTNLDQLLHEPTDAMRYMAVADTTEQYRDQARELIGSVRAMIKPDSMFGRMFSGQTTQPLDTDAVGIDIDVSWVPEGDAAARGAAIAIGWTESYASVTAAHALADAGKARARIYDLYLEELWQLLSAGEIVVDILNRESRTNRTKGTTITAMTHSVSDFSGSVSAAQAETAQAIFEKCQARIYGRIGQRERERLEHFENFTDAEINMLRSWGRAHGIHSADPGATRRDPPGLGHFILKLSEDDGAGIPFRVHVPDSQRRLHNTSARLHAATSSN
ncbi:hypothetical protein AAFP30_27925 [Gordonia sp. CPCC 205515]|uniref:hypothetical protein n=1 Tax=Gordonia sp. CPCC 205515 TaxID=3140791 RepID=UPI003AF3DD84